MMGGTGWTEKSIFDFVGGFLEDFCIESGWVSIRHSMNWREQRHRQSFSVVFSVQIDGGQKFTFPTMGMPSNHPKLDHISIEITIVLGCFGNSRLWSILRLTNIQMVSRVAVIFDQCTKCCRFEALRWGARDGVLHLGKDPLCGWCALCLKKTGILWIHQISPQISKLPKMLKTCWWPPHFCACLGATSLTFPSKMDSHPTLLGQPHLPISRRVLNYLQVMSFSICKSLVFVLYNFEIKSYKIQYFFCD